MRSPFIRAVTEDDRVTLWDRLTKPSKEEVIAAEGVLSEARLFQEWRKMPYAQKFDEWLEIKAHEAVTVGEATTMIVSATRSNTFREILSYFRGMDERARTALGEDV